MRLLILNYLRVHPRILNFFWKVAHIFFTAIGIFIPIREKTILITSFAGRKYDDSPKALYEEILMRHEFEDWDIIWAFVEPEKFSIPRGRKIRIDTWSFFKALLYSKVWISNSGMDRNVGINRKGTIKIETWHGTPVKKIGTDQNSGVLGNYKPSKKVDKETIRCAQSEYDLNIYSRVFNADRGCFLLSDLPRNDKLLRYSKDEVKEIKDKLCLPEEKKILLYMPTYREFLVDNMNRMYLAPPMDLFKWEVELGGEYILLIRAHYAISKALNIKENDFVKDVSNYPYLNDLYIIANILISDYSSSFFDFAILDRPMLCFAYDEEEYAKKRGFYIDIHKELPCSIDKDEDELIRHIMSLDYKKACEETKKFHIKYAPKGGQATKIVIDKLVEKVIN